MIKFIKNLFGFGSAEPAKSQETIREILTPPSKTTVSSAVYIPPTKPVNKVRAGIKADAGAVAPAVTPKPANKKRRPYRGNKVKPAIVDGVTKNAASSVKPVQVAKVKPNTTKSPVDKKK